MVVYQPEAAWIQKVLYQPEAARIQKVVDQPEVARIQMVVDKPEAAGNKWSSNSQFLVSLYHDKSLPLILYLKSLCRMNFSPSAFCLMSLYSLLSVTLLLSS